MTVGVSARLGAHRLGLPWRAREVGEVGHMWDFCVPAQRTKASAHSHGG